MDASLKTSQTTKLSLELVGFLLLSQVVLYRAQANIRYYDFVVSTAGSVHRFHRIHVDAPLKTSQTTKLLLELVPSGILASD
jgi:hypothetical protein